MARVSSLQQVTGGGYFRHLSTFFNYGIEQDRGILFFFVVK